MVINRHWVPKSEDWGERGVGVGALSRALGARGWRAGTVWTGHSLRGAVWCLVDKGRCTLFLLPSLSGALTLRARRGGGMGPISSRNCLGKSPGPAYLWEV